MENSDFTYISRNMTGQECVFREKNNDFFSFNDKDLSRLLRYSKRLAKKCDWAMDIHLPLSLFNNGQLSALEAITKYIKEEIGLGYREIALILNRDERTVWGAYHSSRKKMCDRFSSSQSKFYIPIEIFKDRSLSVLESLTRYLKEKLNLRYCQIASYLNRDDRTIWTVYNRAKKKRRANVENVLS